MLWKMGYKLSKTFADQSGPLKVANHLKQKVEEFKANMPLLHAVCNPGLKACHWDEINELVSLLICVSSVFTLTMSNIAATHYSINGEM